MSSVFSDVHKRRPVNKAANLGAGNHAGEAWESQPKPVDAEVLKLVSKRQGSMAKQMPQQFVLDSASLEKIIIIPCIDVDGDAVSWTAAGCFTGVPKAYPLRYLDPFSRRRDCWPLLSEYCDRRQAACAAVLLGRRLKRPIARWLAKIVTDADLTRFFRDFDL